MLAILLASSAVVMMADHHHHQHPIAMDGMMHGCRERCGKLCRMISDTGISPFLGSTSVEFFQSRHWDTLVPAAWREELLAMPDETLNQELMWGQKRYEEGGEQSRQGELHKFIQALNEVCVQKEPIGKYAELLTGMLGACSAISLVCARSRCRPEGGKFSDRCMVHTLGRFYGDEKTT
jgi:hypothetical protein